MFTLSLTRFHGLALICVLLAAICVPGSSRAASDSEELQRYKTAENIAHCNLATFDNLDFDVFTNQKWDRLKESHAPDILVHWPDGHTTKGIERHIQDLKAMFVYAPDTRIKEHPVKIGTAEWTSVIWKAPLRNRCRCPTVNPSRRPASPSSS
jgi:hypothetical protein